MHVISFCSSGTGAGFIFGPMFVQDPTNVTKNLSDFCQHKGAAMNESCAEIIKIRCASVKRFVYVLPAALFSGRMLLTGSFVSFTITGFSFNSIPVFYSAIIFVTDIKSVTQCISSLQFQPRFFLRCWHTFPINHLCLPAFQLLHRV